MQLQRWLQNMRNKLVAGNTLGRPAEMAQQTPFWPKVVTTASILDGWDLSFFPSSDPIGNFMNPRRSCGPSPQRFSITFRWRGRLCMSAEVLLCQGRVGWGHCLRCPPWQQRLLCRDLQHLGRGSGRRRPSGPRGASRVAGCVSGEAWPAADHRSPSVCPRLGPGVGGCWVALSVPSAPAGVHAHTHACTHTHSHLPPSPVSASSGWPEAGPRAVFSVTLGEQWPVLWWQDSHLADAAAGCGRH